MKNKIKILEMIMKDMAEDARRFDGEPFNGKVVAEYLGCQGAAISALARIHKSLLEALIKIKEEAGK